MPPKLTPNPKNPKRVATPAEVLDRTKKLQKEMADAYASRQNWRNAASTMRRVQSTLSNDPALRKALFTLYKGANIAFVLLPAKKQLQVVKQVERHLRSLANECLQAQNQVAHNPNDPTHPFNQANPTNLANQAQAAQAANIIAQDNQAEEEIHRKDQQQLTIQNSQEIDRENTESMTLTAAEEGAIDEYNATTYNTPTPTPGQSDASNDDDEEIHHVKKEMEHLGEEKALKHFIEGNKEEMKEAFKGIKEIIEKTEHAVQSAVKILAPIAT